MNDQTRESDSEESLRKSGFDFELEPRDYLHLLDLDFDIDAQLIAVEGLLKRNREADKALKEEIKHIEEHTQRLRGLAAEYAVDEWVEQIHHSVYQDAAHSMAAVGMLAPLVETIFHQCFRAIGDHFFQQSKPVEEHERWKGIRAVQWDCHLVITGNRVEKDLVRGILQLAQAVGLQDKFPPDLKKTLSALFGYRNKMFHHGFEWPREERDRFDGRIAQEGWPKEWFSKATTNDHPWIFYLSEVFIHHCFETVENVLNAFRAFVRDRRCEGAL